VKNPTATQQRQFYMTNVPGDGRDPEQNDDGKWNTIRYAIAEWGTTVRLLVVLAVLLGPAYLVVWLNHLAWFTHLV